MPKKHIDDGYDIVDIEEEPTLSQEISKIHKKERNKILKKIITKVFLFILTLFIGISVFSVVSYCWLDSEGQNKAISGLNTNDELFYTKSGVNEDIVKKMKTFVENLPDEQKDAVLSRWKIIVTDKIPNVLLHSSVMDINDYDTSEMVVGGYTFTQQRVVFVNSNLDDETIYKSLVHEVGHLLSFEYGSIHGSKKWEKIFEEDAEKFETDGYNKSNEAEFFASCYEEYFNSLKHLEKNSEKAYNYMKEMQDEKLYDNNILEKFGSGIKNSINTLRVYYYHYIVKR